MDKKLRIVVSLPNDNAYQHEQGVVAKSTGESLGLVLQVMNARDDAITQSRQLLEIIQSHLPLVVKNTWPICAASSTGRCNTM
jgi:hypothetical protein